MVMGGELEPPSPPASKNDGKEFQDSENDELLSQSDVSFSFGPDSSYFLRAGNAWAWNIVGKTMEDINTMNCYSLFVAAITPEQGVVAAYEDKKGSPVWMWAKGENQNILNNQAARKLQTRQEIFDKLATHTDLPSLQQSSLTFGPGGSFFARVKYTTYYTTLPSSLKSQIDSKKRVAEDTESNRVFPLQVALGVGGAWVALWSDKSYTWNLGDHYDTLHQILSTATKDVDSPAFVALSPYEADDFFVVDRAGFIAYSVSNIGKKASVCLDNMTNRYMQLRARKDKIKYQNTRIARDVMKSYVIGPETKFPTELSEMKDRIGTSQESLKSSFLSLKREDMWRRIQQAKIQRRDLIPIATAGLCTATACRYAGLPKRVEILATIGAVTGTGTCCWFLNIFLNDKLS